MGKLADNCHYGMTCKSSASATWCHWVTKFHKETMGLERGLYLYRKMTPPPNFGHFWIIFEGWSQNLPSTKLFRHGFEQSCSTMTTKKLEEKLRQCDEDAESSKTGCRSPSRAHGKADDMCKWLHWFATGMPAASCTQLPFEGALLLIGSKILLVAPLHILGTHLIQRTPPPGGVSYFLCSLIKNPEEEDPTRRMCTRCFEGGPLPPGSWLGNKVNRKTPRGEIIFDQIWDYSLKFRYTQKVIWKSTLESAAPKARSRSRTGKGHECGAGDFSKGLRFVTHVRETHKNMCNKTEACNKSENFRERHKNMCNKFEAFLKVSEKSPSLATSSLSSSVITARECECECVVCVYYST